MMVRAYDNSKRAQKAARTAERIAASTEQLLAALPFGEVTLQAIAEQSKVTVQTVLRHMGSRDGCLRAAAQRVSARIETQRGQVSPGDVPGAIAVLLEHYEVEGHLVLKLLTQASGADEFAKQGAAEGRAYHRAWVQRSFGPLLVGTDEATLDALVAATDLYVWKLLRLDLARSPEATAAVITRLVRAVLESQ